MIQPSLRDLSDRHPKPGVETPGYSQISLWESRGDERAPWREGCREGYGSSCPEICSNLVKILGLLRNPLMYFQCGQRTISRFELGQHAHELSSAAVEEVSQDPVSKIQFTTVVQYFDDVSYMAGLNSELNLRSLSQRTRNTVPSPAGKDPLMGVRCNDSIGC